MTSVSKEADMPTERWSHHIIIRKQNHIEKWIHVSREIVMREKVYSKIGTVEKRKVRFGEKMKKVFSI